MTTTAAAPASVPAWMTSVLDRSELPEDVTWDLAPLYPSAEAWEADFAQIAPLADAVAAFQGRLSDPDAALALFCAEESLDRLLEKLFTYAHLLHDQDTAAPAPQSLDARIRAAYAEAAARCAWITPELAALPAETLEAWAALPAFAPWARRLRLILRSRPHVLSTEAETLLAQASEVLSAPEQTFSMLTDADLRFPDVRDSSGAAHELTESTYRTLVESPDRALRLAAHETLLGTYGQFRNTIASTLSACVKEHVFDARARHFPSAIEASLFGDEIPVALYNALIDATHAALPAFHDYVALRARVLGLAPANADAAPDAPPALSMADMYVPLVPASLPPPADIPPATARAWVEHALRPLGPGYLAILARAFDQRWIDWPTNRGKTSGAYSSGCYDSYPYLLLNYRGRLDDVFTLAHEAGHSVHSALSRAAQPHSLADYPIFLAEIASTTNEILLARSLLDDPPPSAAAYPSLRLHVLNHLVDEFKGTLYRQVMFAEFERDLHRWAESDVPLTAQHLCDSYAALNAAYYGPLVPADGPIRHEWERIPHFYYDFYVYKYATSFSAALVIAQRILAGGPVEPYLAMLRSGGSRPPLETLRDAGVDLTDPSVVASAYSLFATLLADFKKELESVS